MCRAGGKDAETLEIGYPQWKSVSSDFDRISAGLFGSCKAIWHRDMCRNQKYDVLLDRIKNGSKWQFRLKANPVVYKKIAQSKRGKPVAHITTAYQEEWLEKQAAKHGFVLEEDQWLVTESKWYRFRKGDSRQYVRILAVTYEGILTVTDAECFQLSLMQGIGRGKAYGLGMLTVAGEH